MTPEKRFDEIELVGSGRRDAVSATPSHLSGPANDEPAPLWRRCLALLLDLSLFGALLLTLGPLFPDEIEPVTVLAAAGFITLFSFFYFTTGWMVWGRTLGAAVANVRIIGADPVGVTFRRSARRWSGLVASILSGGLGFLPALFPAHLSLADRISRTRVVK